MTVKELMQLKDGTLVYNGHSEGVIKTEYGIKVIETSIQISTMSNDANHYDEKPEFWDVLDD